MYESHFGLNKKPFQITTDPSFLWLGKKHRDALTTLKYGVMDNKGFLLLTGDVGTGKTTLINRLIDDFKDKVYTAKIPDPRLTKYDFFRMVSKYFKLPIEVRTKSDFIDPFTRFLSDAHQEKKSVLLLIDEAQRLKQDLMEEIRLLSNLERHDSKLLNIFFVGQNEFNNTLLQPENRALMRRITITYNIDPLNQDETGQYIRHRLKVAGADYDIFSAGAVEEVYDFSKGFPRQINIISDLAMFFTSQMDQRTIRREVVQQCRKRISFSIEEVPVKPQKQVMVPIGGLPPAPQTVAQRSTFSKLKIAIWVVLLLACGAGTYYTAPEWKARLRQWIQQVGKTDEQPPRAVVETPREDNRAKKALPAPAETVGSMVEGQSLPATDIPDIPLRIPQPPPEVDSGEALEPERSVLFGADQLPSAALPSVGDGAAASARPDPADAVEWVLKKRQRDKQP